MTDKFGLLRQMGSLILSVLGVWLLITANPTWAQTEPWSNPLNLFETEGRASEAEVVTDPSGVVHVFWAYGEPGNDSGSGQAIYYTRRQDGAWSEPVDIVVSPGNRVARMHAVAADAQGYLHIVWSGGDSIFYSRAYAPDAGNSRGWAPPNALDSGAGNGTPAIAVSDTGEMYVIWTRNGSGLMFIQSQDGGQSWSEPRVIFAASGAKELAASGRIAVDGKGRLHVVFTHAVEDAEPVGQGMYPRNPFWLYYLRSDDRGETWSEPNLMTPEPDFGEINVAVFGEDTVHVVWNGRAGRHGRYHRWSKDGGTTWSNTVEVIAPAPQNPLGTGGLTGFPALVTDATGALHMVSNTEGNQYLRWQDGSWSAPILISRGLDGNGVTGERNSLEQPSIALGLGNQLHVVFHDGFERIWYTGTTIGAPFEQPATLTLPTPDAISAAVETVPVTATPTSSAEPSPAPVFSPQPRPASSGSPGMAILMGVMPVVVLVSAVVIYSRQRRK